MSNYQQFPQILLQDVFKRLATGLSANTTVVTPNRRLVLALKNQFNHFQATQKLSVWDSADILPFSALIERVYKDALYSMPEAKWPLLLTTAQVHALWESVISSSDHGKLLLAIPQTAKLVHEAWQLVHAWRLVPKLKNFPQSIDNKVFLEWSQCFEHVTWEDNQTDDARLWDQIIASYAHLQIKKPANLICYGFDNFTLQQTAFLEKLAATGCEVMSAQPISHCQPKNVNVQRIVCVDSRDEINRAAVWARERIERDQMARIGVVVPALSKYRHTIVRIFSSVMEPDIASALPGTIRQTLPFNVSLGVALTSYPIINAIVQILRFAGDAVEFERASLLVRSPFLGGGGIEMANRALLDAKIRKRAGPIITLEQLLILIKREKGDVSCPYLVRQLTALIEFRLINLQGQKQPSSWAKVFSVILQLVGFPGERTLDSAEYQTLKKWYEVVADFATLDNVIFTVGYQEAISKLRHLAIDTLFQPETPDVPIQILGVLEADGLEFDHLWVMGLSEGEWPLHPRPNPFLSVGLQRAAKLPMGSADESLVFSQRLTNRWLSCASDVVFSHPDWNGDNKIKPSALIRHITQTTLDLPNYPSHRDLIQQKSRLEYCKDCDAPALNDCEIQPDGVAVGGGTMVIKDFAACPFRAFAKHRLFAESLKAPHTGLNAMERGMLVHDVLAQIWRHLRTKVALDQVAGGELDRLIKCIVSSAIKHTRRDRSKMLSDRFVEIEQRRLINLVSEWLEEERKRGYFTVVAIEDKQSIRIGGLTLTARLDRVDELDDGQRIIIDYKTQKLSIKTMLGERPEEPQLPLYLIFTEPNADAVAFASVKVGDARFIGIAHDEDILPGIKVVSSSCQLQEYESWTVLVESWRKHLEALAKSFRSGDARVDPKHYPTTCRYCDVHPFCRIYEKINISDVAQDEEA